MDDDQVSLINVIKGTASKEDFFNKYNVRLYFDKLPNVVNGYVFIYRGIYNIHINKDLENKEKDKTIIHELAHIERNEIGLNNLSYGFRCSIKGRYDKADEYIDKILEEL